MLYTQKVDKIPIKYMNIYVGSSEQCGITGVHSGLDGFTQVVDSPTRGNALLDVYLVCPESSFTASSLVQEISDHYRVILEVE